MMPLSRSTQELFSSISSSVLVLSNTTTGFLSFIDLFIDTLKSPIRRQGVDRDRYAIYGFR